MLVSELSVLVDDLTFPEGLAWRDRELWFSDFGSRRVSSVTPDGTVTERAYVVSQPSGVSFLPDGTPVVVSMHDRLLVRLGDGHASLHADASGVCIGPMNDMIVDRRGRTYFGSFGYDPSYEGGDALRPSPVGLVSEDGTVQVVADDLMFPNGMAITDDGATLVIAETFASRLTAFSINEDGTLGERRIFADLGERAPDGICMDAEGAVWAGCPFAEEFVRVADGGEILETVPTPGRWAVACALGGDDGRTLFCATAQTTLEQFHQGQSTGAIEVIRVSTPGQEEKRS
jgi:sugar lactone lactonase YvrE